MRPSSLVTSVLIIHDIVLTLIQIIVYYNFRAEQRVSSNLIGRAVPYMTLYKPLQAVYITFRGLATKRATFPISASKHGGQLVNEFFIYSEDITLSPGYLKG